MAEIVENDFNLNISRYVSTATAEEEIDLAAVHAKLMALDEKIATATKAHNAFLQELDCPLCHERRILSSPVRSNLIATVMPVMPYRRRDGPTGTSIYSPSHLVTVAEKRSTPLGPLGGVLFQCAE
jgi:hypothetical protein